MGSEANPNIMQVSAIEGLMSEIVKNADTIVCSNSEQHAARVDFFKAIAGVQCKELHELRKVCE